MLVNLRLHPIRSLRNLNPRQTKVWVFYLHLGGDEHREVLGDGSSSRLHEPKIRIKTVYDLNRIRPDRQRTVYVSQKLPQPGGEVAQS